MRDVWGMTFSGTCSRGSGLCAVMLAAVPFGDVQDCPRLGPRARPPPLVESRARSFESLPPCRGGAGRASRGCGNSLSSRPGPVARWCRGCGVVTQLPTGLLSFAPLCGEPGTRRRGRACTRRASGRRCGTPAPARSRLRGVCTGSVGRPLLGPPSRFL